MLLLLDVVSPIPEFSLIEDNKFALNTKIIQNESLKLSDNIFQTYVKISKDIDLSNKLTKVILTTGPGSYTSLRVGAAFIAGLSIAKELPLCTLSAADILNIKKNNFKNDKIAIYISSANNQNFLCTSKDEKIEYTKVEKNNFYLNNDFDTVFYNHKKISKTYFNGNQVEISLKEEILSNYKELTFKKNSIIRPIYISNNNILN